MSPPRSLEIAGSSGGAACTTRRGRADWTVTEHRAAVAALVSPVPAVTMPLADCLGLVLAQDVRAATPLPPFTNSAMDGFAVRVADLVNASVTAPVTLRVTEHIPAGRVDRPSLAAGSAHRIMTGAPLPEGADAVVPVELAEVGEASVTFAEPVARTHVRFEGEDVCRGEVVVPRGRQLSAAQLAAAAGAGADRIVVYRPIRVAVIATGSELVEAGSPLQDGQIPDSNSVMLAGAVRSAGAEVVHVAVVSDDPHRLRTTLDGDLGDPDVVLTAGGISKGDREVVKDVLSGSPTMTFGEVALRPGAPQGFGRHNGVPIVALPGNPVAAWVSFHVFLHDPLRAAMRRSRRRSATARLAEPLHGRPGQHVVWLGRHDRDSDWVSPMPRGSHLLSALADANCLIESPESAPPDMPAGDLVRVTRTDSGADQVY
jgi:molybdopterin molybdotransferase